VWRWDIILYSYDQSLVIIADSTRVTAQILTLRRALGIDIFISAAIFSDYNKEALFQHEVILHLPVLLDRCVC
jgi:hypothetical protein